MDNKTTKNYSLRQLMLTFAYLAYTGEEIQTPNPEQQILESINAALPQIKLNGNEHESPADWDVVWGPGVYTVPGAKYQENMAYVVNRRGTSDFVIASRGTNFVSQVDWFLDDFELFYTMPWPIPGAHSNTPKGAAISESTSIDLNIHIQSNVMSDQNGMGLMNFLRNITLEGKVNICVTGHSLGAAVANVLSLYLIENPEFWDNTMESTVSCISFAAPTIGNNTFAENALKVFEDAAKHKGSFPGWDDSMGTNLDNVGCNLDTVPLFSTATNIYEHGDAGPLFSIYASPNNPSNNIEFSIENLTAKGSIEWHYFKLLVLPNISKALSAQEYTQLNTSSIIKGEFKGKYLSIYDSDFPTYMEAFAAQAAWQHSNSYPIFLDVPTLFDPSIVQKGSNTNAKKPVISSISPNSTKHHYLSNKVTVTIKGENFATGLFSNFIEFSEPNDYFSYQIKSVSETQIVAVLQLEDLEDGEYSISICHTSPHFKSNGIPFTVKSNWFE